MFQRLEVWRVSIPEKYRPGEPIQQLNQLATRVSKLVAVQIQYMHFSMRMVLDRLMMQISGEHEARRRKSKHDLMYAARTIVETTRHIEMEPHVPML